jgi:hypothetical protein
MLPTSWQGLVTLFLWIAPHVLLCVLAVILCKRRLYTDFPCFFAYVLYEIAEFGLMFGLYFVASVTKQQYVYVYCATLAISVALRFGMIDEVSRDLFRESRMLKSSARRLLQCVTGLLFMVGILLAVYAPGDNRIWWAAGASVVSRGAAMIQCGLLLALLLFSRFLGLSWRRPTFGIAVGLGVLTSVDLAVYSLRAEWGGGAWVPYLNLLATGTYLICVLIWIAYLRAPELQPASPAVLPRNEVEIWNMEFQHLLRD